MTDPLLTANAVTRTYSESPDFLARGLIALGAKEPPDVVHALNGIDLAVQPGEILGVVGESGCGKSTLGRLLVGLEAPDSGDVRFEGKPVRSRGEPANLALQMIFQDASASFNPRRTIGDQIVEAPLAHGLVPPRAARDFVADLLEKVGLPADAAVRYPHQFSGGQRQRLNIARALAVGPKLIVCDESVASLDLSVQAQILNLLLDLRRNENLTLVFISHDLSVVNRIADRVAVLYLGHLVEFGSASDVFGNARHPYTQALNGNRLSLHGNLDSLTVLEGEPPSPTRMPAGCPFHPRCPIAVDACAADLPPRFPPAGDHWAACIRQPERSSDRVVAQENLLAQPS